MPDVLHEDEYAIDAALVRRLIGTLLPERAGGDVRPLGETGSSNALFRLDDDLLVRLPRQPGGSQAIDVEARWSPLLAAALPVAVPEVVAVGAPAFGFAERWSVTRWIDGHIPDREAVVPTLGVELADVVLALGDIEVPGHALADPALRTYRARPLVELDDVVRQYQRECRDVPGRDLDLDACARVWDDAMRLPTREGPPRWLHGDLFAENLLVRSGHLAAVLDLGGLGVGDPTVDLVVAWDLLGPADRATFRAALDLDEPTWLRGRAWAMALSVMTFPYYWRTMPQRCAARLATAHAVLADY